MFIALDPPGELTAELAAWLREAAVGADTRPVPAADMHLTLCFLGRREAAEIELAERALEKARDAALGPLRSGAPVWLPRRHPRALAIEVHDPSGALGDLQADLARALAASIDWQEPRAFRPHLTVARFGRGAQPRRGPLPPTPDREFTGEAVTLYHSILRPEGAKYEPIASTAAG